MRPATSAAAPLAAAAVCVSLVAAAVPAAAGTTPSAATPPVTAVSATTPARTPVAAVPKAARGEFPPVPKAARDLKPQLEPSLQGSPTAAAPALGTATQGKWYVWTPVTMPRGRSEILVLGDGTPLWGDWDGDGLATPGRYSAGQWFTATQRIDLAENLPSVQFGGDPADLPVVGDWNGDGVDDPGVFRNGIWYLRNPDGSSSTLAFGRAGDRPVVGDWNGDGIDDVGVVRAGTWYLRFPAGATAPEGVKPKLFVTDKKTKVSTLTLGFGGVTDIPVPGDWDGDGTATPGVFRGPDQWLVAPTYKRLAKPKALTYAVDTAAGQVPMVVPIATASLSCPTVSVRNERRGYELAATVNPPIPLAGDETAPQWSDVIAAARDGGRYLIVQDLADRLSTQRTAAYYDALAIAGIKEYAIRRPANAAASVALVLGTAPWDEASGITVRFAERYARWQIRSVACQHLANTPGGWGNDWQSALWATVAGHAAWSMWDRMMPQERAYVANMVAAEADFVVARGPRYYISRDGTVLTPGNSRADEVAWDLLAPALAAAMLPNDSRVTAWRTSLVHHAMAAFARPADLVSAGTLNGINIAASLGGSNANDDFTITNHGLYVTPDYIQNVSELWWAASMLRAGGQTVPEMLFFNADSMYRTLSQATFTAPPFLDPGGTVYRADGSIYYPAGVDWGTRRPATFAGVDALAAIYADPTIGATTWLALHAGDVRAMQARFNDGRMYADDIEESYRGGKEEYAAHQLALGWWAKASAYTARLKIDNGPYPPPGG